MTSKRINFTKAALDAAKAPGVGQRAVYLDGKIAGLQLRVTATGAKTFSLFRRTKGGRPERITLGQYPTMSIEQARRQAAQLNAAIEDHKNPAEVRRALRGELTFADLFKEYLDRHSRPRKRTWQEDESKFKQYLARPIGDRRLSTLARSDIALIHGAITRAGHSTTANRVLALISSIFGWGISVGLAESNPARGIKRNPERSRDRFLRSDELPRFFRSLAAEQNTTMRDFFLLCLLTGARRENVLAMQWRDVSLEAGEWRIPRTKNDAPQTVMLAPQAIDVLGARHLKRNGPFVFQSDRRNGHIVEPKRAWERILDRDEFQQITSLLESKGVPFVIRDKERPSSALSRARKQALAQRIDLDETRLTDLRIHDLRRTLGSWQAKLGASLAIIGKSLNHKTMQATMIYARLEADPVRESVNRAATAIVSAGRRLLPDAEAKGVSKPVTLSTAT